MSPDSFARKFEVERRDKTTIVVAIALILSAVTAFKRKRHAAN